MTTDNNIIIVRGGGDIASGVAARLFNSGFDVIILETKNPSAIRRSVSFSEAVYDGHSVVEGIKAFLAVSAGQCFDIFQQKSIPVLIDENMEVFDYIKPLAVVDAVIAKKNIGLHKNLADIVIALGDGFEAGVDTHAVVETMRGHNLGRIYYEGRAVKNTGVPGSVNGVTSERVIHAHCSGKLNIKKDIGSVVLKGEQIALIEGQGVSATIDGLIRGMIRDGYLVSEGLKIADIDPRVDELKNCYTISDKARALGGSVLEAVLYLKGKSKHGS